jgi:hypothetical protein
MVWQEEWKGFLRLRGPEESCAEQTLMARAIAAACVCLLAFIGSAYGQKPESYATCMKRFPEAGKYRLGAKVLEGMVQQRSLPQATGLPKDKDADANIAILIDQHGSVACAAGFSGEPALVEASVQAARQWKFAPYLLDGRPIVVGANLYFHYSKGRVVAGFVPYEKKP